MQIKVQAQVLCNRAELVNNSAFVQADEFARYDAEIEIICRETAQQRQYSCSQTLANCYGWRHFKDEWERQYGKLNP